MSSLLTGLQKIKEAFLPFWVVKADATVQLRGARIGFDRWVTRWDPRARRNVQHLETFWQWVSLQRTNWEQPYTSHDQDMQVGIPLWHHIMSVSLLLSFLSPLVRHLAWWTCLNPGE